MAWHVQTSNAHPRGVMYEHSGPTSLCVRGDARGDARGAHTTLGYIGLPLEKQMLSPG